MTTDIAAPPASEKYRRHAELFLLVACSSLAAFLIITLAALAAPALIIRSLSHLNAAQFLIAIIFTIICLVIAALLPLGMVSLFRALKPRQERGFIGGSPRLSPASWAPIAFGSVAVLVIAVIFLLKWSYRLALGDFRGGLLASIRYLGLTSGVSPLVPLLFVSLAGFLWATSSFHRLRMLEGLGSNRGFLCLAGRRFQDIHMQEKELRHLLLKPSWHLPGFMAVLIVGVSSVFYLFILRLVPSLEDCVFYLLLGLAYLVVSLALWSGALRFWCVWGQTRHLLQHLAWTEMRTAVRRFRVNLPGEPKIDLAMEAPSLAPLSADEKSDSDLCGGDPLSVVRRQLVSLPAS